MSEESFTLGEYECIAFDFDNTLVHYNLTNLLTMQYKILRDLMVRRGFKREYFSEDLSSNDIDFIQKGLFMDFEKGNILQLGGNGLIRRASHGTHQLTEKEIAEVYGPEKHWAVTDLFCRDKLSTWNGPLSDLVRPFLDYTDCQASLIFAQAVDCIDGENGRPDKYDIRSKLISSIVEMFQLNGDYIQEIRRAPEMYITKCLPEVKDWLGKLRESGKFIALITGSTEEDVNWVGNYWMDESWKDFFDVLIYEAKKPAFFTENRPFIYARGQLKMINLNQSKEYSGGNWKGIQKYLRSLYKKREPKAVYIGDNILQDVYSPGHHSTWDTVALVEELYVEGVSPLEEEYEHSSFVRSMQWGSYLQGTVWGDIINDYGKLAVPSLLTFAQEPIDFEFQPVIF